MSCMEHTCRFCGELILNNDTPDMMKGVKCPKCESSNWVSICDELPITGNGVAAEDEVCEEDE